MHHPRSIVSGLLVALLALAAVSQTGCEDGPKKRLPPSPPPSPAPAPLPRGAYPDGPEGLQHLWNDILAACRKDKRAQVQRLFSSMTMTQEELASVLGPERAGALWPSYQHMMLVMAERGSEELMQRMAEKKYDEVIPVLVNEQPAEERSPTDQRVLKALVRQVPLYSVRVKRDYEMTGLRYEFFVYLDGRWRTGSQLAEQLPPVPAPAPAPK